MKISKEEYIARYGVRKFISLPHTAISEENGTTWIDIK